MYLRHNSFYILTADLYPHKKEKREATENCVPSILFSISIEWSHFIFKHRIHFVCKRRKEKNLQNFDEENSVLGT